eukprot:6491326-Amphidinium_carterae.5
MAEKKTLRLENNEDKEDKNRMETIMKDIQLQPQSLKEVDSRTLTQQQLQEVLATRWVVTERPSNNGTNEVKCRYCGKALHNSSMTLTFRHSLRHRVQRQCDNS